MDGVPDSNAGRCSSVVPDASAKRPVTLVHAAYPLWRKHTLVSLARAKELQDAGHDVTVSYCGSTAGTCAVNYSGNPVACQICQSRVTRTATELGLKTVALKTQESNPDQQTSLKYSEKQQLVEGVNSGIISTFRTMPEECRDVPAIYRIRRNYYRNATRLLKAMKGLVQRVRPDQVEVFNGRHACSKFAIVAATSAGLPFNTLEVTARQKPIVHLGHVVHDRKGVQRRILNQPADMELAARFYGNRRSPQGNKFAKKHKVEFVPPETEGYRRSVSIFLSSQDEFASLGPDWQSPFLDYAPIVQAACEAHPDVLFCIRFHPNQADVAGDIVAPFATVRSLPNTKIYEPTDQVNSYSLMDWSDIVVTFGSTMTIEACWAGKSVILLGPSYFDELDVSYNPQSCEEFVELLGKDLSPKNRENAARFACYQELDGNSLRYVKNDGLKIEAEGFVMQRPWLGQLARTCDDVVCNVIKLWAKHKVKSGKRKVA